MLKYKTKGAGHIECLKSYIHIFSFAIPDEGKTEFDSNSEYFLGPIVTFRNEDKLEAVSYTHLLSFKIELPSVAGVKTRDCHW